MPDLAGLRARLAPAARGAGKRAAGHAAALLDGIARGKPPRGVLVYHRIVDPVPGLPTPTWNVPPGRFREQMEDLRARGTRFATVDNVIRGADAVAVTFDDVFGSVVTHALPILRQLGIPSSVFVASAWVGQDRLPFDDWPARDRAPVHATRAASRAELAVLVDDDLVEVGAHTHTHGDFRGRPDAFEADLRTNVDWLAGLGVERPLFAFPYGRTAHGYAGGELSRRARQSGARCGLTTDAEVPAWDADPFAFPRVNAYAWDTGRTLAAKLRGHYAWAPRAIERLAG